MLEKHFSKEELENAYPFIKKYYDYCKNDSICDDCPFQFNDCAESFWFIESVKNDVEDILGVEHDVE